MSRLHVHPQAPVAATVTVSYLYIAYPTNLTRLLGH